MIKYSVKQRVNPRDLQAVRKYYASTTTADVVELKGLAKHISMLSTVSRTDATAVLTALIEILPLELLEGKLVRLGELGSLRVTLSSEGVDNEEDFKHSNIKQARVRFLPSQELREEMANAKFAKH